MMNDTLKGYLALGVIVICIIILIVRLVMSMLKKKNGDAPKTSKQPKKQKTPKKQKSGKRENHFGVNLPGGKNKTEETPAPVYQEDDFEEEDDTNPTALLKPSTKTIELISVSQPGFYYKTICNSRIIIGKSDTCDIQIKKDPAVTGEHCSISKYSDEIFMLEDLDSKNGTYLNREKITRSSPVSVGDRIIVGQIEYKINIY